MLFDTRRLAAGAAVLLLTLAFALPAQAQGTKQPIHYLLLPQNEPPAAERPSLARIRRFRAEHPAVENTAEGLTRDLEFARAVLGQRRVFADAAAFGAAHPGYEIRVHFIDAAEWFAGVQAAVNARTGPFVSQLGDTWVPYFTAQGVIPPGAAVRYTNDVRFLWYWRDLVRPEELRQWGHFLAETARLRREGMTPLALPTAREPDVLWNFYVWLRAAGGQLVFVEPDWVGWRGWHPVWRGWTDAALQDEPGQRAARALMLMVERDYLELPERNGLEVTREFLDRRCAMVVMEPWVAWQAARRWREQPGWVARERLPADWRQALGATLLPPIGGEQAGTFIGGSMLAVVDPGRGARPEAAAAAREWLEFLVRRTTQEAELEALQFLPADQRAWATFRYREFFNQAMLPLGGDASPAALDRLRATNAPPPRADWPAAVERPEVFDQLYWFWKRLAGLPRLGSTGPDRSLARRQRLALQALADAAREMNQHLSPGLWWVQALWFLAALAPLAMLAGAAAQRAAARRREERWREQVTQDRVEIELLGERLRDLEELLAVAHARSPAAPPDEGGG